MEQNRKSRGKPMNLWTPYLWQRSKNIQWSEHNLFNKCCWVNWSSTCRRMKLEHFLTPSDQISRSVMSDSLWPHESQHARPPCPSPTPRVHWDSRPSSQWCHPAISSSVVPFSSWPQSFPASGSFPMNQLFAWGGHKLKME